MSTQPALLLDSYDVPGLSVLTSTVTAENPRYGGIYNPLSLAAAVPVHFHPMVDGDFLALFSSRWTDAVVGDTAQSYLDYTESTVPSWAVIASGIGLRGAVSDITVRTPHSLTGACSKQNNFFTVGQDDDGNAVVGMYRVSTLGMITLQNEEIVPPVNEVVFSRGCYIDALFGVGALVLLGTDPSGGVYAARKNWSRVGTPGGWTYHGIKGWLDDNATMVPMGPVSVGPVSVMYRRARLWMTTVVEDTERQRKSLLYTGKGFDSWKKTGDEIDLGDDDTYLGGGLYLQPQLNTNLAMDLTGSGVPYVASVKVTVEDESGISTFWNLRSLT